MRDGSVPKNVYIGRSPLQKRTDSGILCFSTPQLNMDVPLNDIAIKGHKYTKYVIKVQNFFRFQDCFPCFKFSIICVDKRD